MKTTTMKERITSKTMEGKNTRRKDEYVKQNLCEKNKRKYRKDRRIEGKKHA